METIQVVHRFRTLVNRGFITPLACSMCRGDLNIRLGENDDPIANCYRCGSRSNISMATVLTMERAIANYERGRVV